MVKGSERKLYKKWLKSLGLFGLEEAEGRSQTSYNFVMKESGGADTDLFALVASDGTQGIAMKL